MISTYNPNMHPLDALEDLDAYRHLFTDVALWMPYVQEVCHKHNLDPHAAVRLGVPGTCPVFLAGESMPGGIPRWVVKFFGRLFDGAQGFAAEQEAARLTALDPRIRTAQLLASGELGAPGWPWPYLIFEYIPGVSIGQVFGQLSLTEKLRAAEELGETVRRMHALPLEGSTIFPNSYQPYLSFLEGQRRTVVERQRAWGSLPEPLVEQIEGFLPPLEALIDPSRPPHVIHADLTGDHLLGRLDAGGWTSLAVIDFGDARTGDLLYELSALHLDCFRCDRRLLQAFLNVYGLDHARRTALPRKALAAALLHQFDVFAGVPPAILAAPTLDELARRLWEV